MAGTDTYEFGYKFGDYILLEHLGSGNFGMVYKAAVPDPGTGDPCKRKRNTT